MYQIAAEICNAQSMGAAIENMTLAATALGRHQLERIMPSCIAFPALFRYTDSAKKTKV